jgi:hypothetical protein
MIYLFAYEILRRKREEGKQKGDQIRQKLERGIVRGCHIFEMGKS